MPVKVEQGGEYQGETYVWCDVCAHPDFIAQTFSWKYHLAGVFQGNSIEALNDFIKEHSH